VYFVGRTIQDFNILLKYLFSFVFLWMIWNPQIQVSTNMSIVVKPWNFVPTKLNDFTVWENPRARVWTNEVWLYEKIPEHVSELTRFDCMRKSLTSLAAWWDRGGTSVCEREAVPSHPEAATSSRQTRGHGSYSEGETGTPWIYR